MVSDAALRKLEAIISDAAARAVDWTARRNDLVVDEKSAGQFASNADVDIEARLRRDLSATFEETSGVTDVKRISYVFSGVCTIVRSLLIFSAMSCIRYSSGERAGPFFSLRRFFLASSHLPSSVTSG